MLLKKEIKKCLGFVLCILAFVSCTTNNDSLAFVIPDNQAEIAKLELTTESSSSSFYYSLLAKQLIIEWGDKSRTSEYVHSDQSWTNIRPIEHLYNQVGTYSVNIRTNSPFAFNFSKNDSANLVTTITKIDLLNCYTLSEFYCQNQPISKLDLSSCNNLLLLDIAGASISDLTFKLDNKINKMDINNTGLTFLDVSQVPHLQSLSIGIDTLPQQIVGIEALSDLKSISVKGKIAAINLDLSQNDSLQIFEALETNIQQLNLQYLAFLDSVSVKSCSDLTGIKLGSNNSLSSLKLIDNTSLSATSLNTIFGELPLATGRRATIRLSGNAGDNTCDRSIATSKGWVFE